MKNSRSVQEKDKILWDFEIERDHLIPARRPNLELIDKKKKNLPSSGLCCLNGLQSENKVKRKQRHILSNCLKKLWIRKVTVIPIVVGVLGTVPKGSEKGLRRGGNWRTNQEISDYSTVEISQKTQESLGDLRRLAITQTPVKTSANAGVKN